MKMIFCDLAGGYTLHILIFHISAQMSNFSFTCSHTVIWYLLGMTDFVEMNNLKGHPNISFTLCNYQLKSKLFSFYRRVIQQMI